MDFKQVSEEEFLAHYGVPGMKWGQRKNALPGVSAKTNRTAAKDAKEAARAKVYYGEGAGVRRRLINNTVKSRSVDKSYKKAFDHHMSNQKMDKRAAEARSKRKRTDIAKGTAKTSRGIVNVLKGNMRYASAASVMLVGAYGVARKTGADKVIFEHGKKAYSAVVNEVKTGRIRQMFNQ